MATFSFDTAQPSQTIGLGGYTIDPIFTVGDNIKGYVPPGILDGIGAFSLNETTVRLYVNHEIGNTVGYKYKLSSGAELSGTRVSYFDVDKRTFQIVDSGLAYNKIINRAGNEVQNANVYSSTNVNGIDNAPGLGRFCSASLFEATQFGSGRGLADRIFFTGEESNNASQYALDTKTNILYALPWFGRAGFENVTEVDTGTTTKVAFLIGDDRSPNAGVPLLLYVGDKVANSTDFLARNGLTGGKLYAWGADDPTANDVIESDVREFNGTTLGGNLTTANPANLLKGKFVEIKLKDAVDQAANPTSYDSLGFATQTKQDSLYFSPTVAANKAFGFVRIEDVATNPKNGTEVAFNATGNSTVNFGQAAGVAGPDAWGTVYKIKLDFTGIATGDIRGNVSILNDGNLTKDTGLRSPDNLDWATDGKLYLQEDPAISAFGQTTPIANSIFSLDPSNADPVSTLTRIAVSDRSAAALPATQTDANPISTPTNIGNWETSGILDVSKLFNAAPGQVLVFDTQAHSLKDGNIASQNLVEGGQLAFLIAPNAKLVQSSSLVAAGSSAPDTIESGVTAGFDGVNDIVFAGAGDDLIDTGLAGALASGNRVDAGSGKDQIFVSTNDRAFGGDGDDEFFLGFARNASDYRASGGAGNDTFRLLDSTDGRLVGGDGDDKFFVSKNSGGNLLFGGAGADQFWIFSAEAPVSKNTVLDFVAGTDVIGLIGSGTNFAGLTRVGNDISLGGKTLATLIGVDTTTLTATNFAFV